MIENAALSPFASSIDEIIAVPKTLPVILVVDDQASNVLTLYEILRGEYEVCAATTGEDTFAFCRTRQPDLILLDVGLPGMDGYEVCRWLKNDQTMRDIPVIFVTAHTDPLEEARAFDFGAVDFISKPYHAKVVKARVRTQITLKSQSDKLRALATTDGLTGLANRRRFDQALVEEWRRANRDQAPLSLLMLDVDRFKAFNDIYGHQAGDRCLQAVSAAIKGFARRPGDLVARYGGEEMVILLPRADERFADMTAESVRQSVETLAISHNGNGDCGGVVTVSVGIATFRVEEPSIGPEMLVSAADQMLYEAKRTGRNKVMSRVSLLVNPVAPIPPDEEQRIAAVDAFRAVQLGHRSAFLDDIARLAATLVGTPIGLVSLVGRDQQYFCGRYGFEMDSTSREASFCTHVIGGESPMVVPDATADPRFQSNPLVTGELGIRFYAGAPLVSPNDGPNLGTVCVIDETARTPLTAEQNTQLAQLASLAADYIERHLTPSD